MIVAFKIVGTGNSWGRLNASSEFWALLVVIRSKSSVELVIVVCGYGFIAWVERHDGYDAEFAACSVELVCGSLLVIVVCAYGFIAWVKRHGGYDSDIDLEFTSCSVFAAANPLPYA